MANEGIMSLPAGLGMQGKDKAQNAAPTVTSADSYDAAQTALGMVDPKAQAASKEAIRAAIGDLQRVGGRPELLCGEIEQNASRVGRNSAHRRTAIGHREGTGGDAFVGHEPRVA